MKKFTKLEIALLINLIAIYLVIFIVVIPKLQS